MLTFEPLRYNVICTIVMHEKTHYSRTKLKTNKQYLKAYLKLQLSVSFLFTYFTMETKTAIYMHLRFYELFSNSKCQSHCKLCTRDHHGTVIYSSPVTVFDANFVSYT